MDERKNHAEELAEARISAKDALMSRDAYKTQLEAVKAELEKTNASYQKLMAENLEQTKSLTASHEENLRIYKERDDLTEKLKKAKRISKAVVTM
jgi:intein-encoded DNA endonuclease-like protein